ncbi:MAG: hypothetical protein JXR23_02350 [Pontiellaceae bacterium]|nr:hypothetical protein [Pontiellaceae bacterium]
MKNVLSRMVSIVFAATLFYVCAHFFVIPYNARKSAFIGETGSFAQIEGIMANEEFSMSQLKQYIRAKEYMESPRKQKIAYASSFCIAVFMVSAYGAGRYLFKRIFKQGC